MQDYEFDRATTVRQVDEDTYSARLDAGWTIEGTVVAGGYALAVMARAALSSLPGKPDPIGTSAHFLSACSPGEATLRVRKLKDGRTASTAAVDLLQADEVRISALVTCADLDRLGDRAGSFSRTFVTPQHLDSVSAEPASDFSLRDGSAPFLRQVHVHPRADRAAVDADHDNGSLSAKLRLADGRPPDALSLLMFCDSLPPITYGLGLTGWAPTLQMSVHLRARPRSGWLSARHGATSVEGGLLDEDCLIWDADGQLVAQSRQLAMQPR